MKKICLFLVVAFVCFFGVSAGASELLGTWEYLDPPSDLVGFTLYYEGAPVWVGTDPSQREVSFSFDLPDGNGAWQITAEDQNSSSLPSDVYCFDPLPGAVMSLTVSEKK